MAELENLPYGLSSRAPIQKVRDMYVQSFRDIRSFPRISSAAEELQFTELLQTIYQRHVMVVPLMAQGVVKLREDLAAGRVEGKMLVSRGEKGRGAQRGRRAGL